jgi:hypothetical protein
MSSPVVETLPLELAAAVMSHVGVSAVPVTATPLIGEIANALLHASAGIVWLCVASPEQSDWSLPVTVAPPQPVSLHAHAQLVHVRPSFSVAAAAKHDD